MTAEQLREAADRLDMLSDMTPLNVTINPRIAQPLAAWLRYEAGGVWRLDGARTYALAVAAAILGGAA